MRNSPGDLSNHIDTPTRFTHKIVTTQYQIVKDVIFRNLVWDYDTLLNIFDGMLIQK